MPQGPYKPDMSDWEEVIDLVSKRDANNYIAVGWKLIEVRTHLDDQDTEFSALKIWRLGWPKNAGPPVSPPATNDTSDNEQIFSDN